MSDWERVRVYVETRRNELEGQVQRYREGERRQIKEKERKYWEFIHTNRNEISHEWIKEYVLYQDSLNS